MANGSNSSNNGVKYINCKATECKNNWRGQCVSVFLIKIGKKAQCESFEVRESSDKKGKL